MDSLNHYAYANCNPILFSDPTGLVSVKNDVDNLMGRLFNDYLNMIYISNPNYVLSKSEFERKAFDEAVNLLSGYDYGGNGVGFDDEWVNDAEQLVCTSFAEDVLRFSYGASTGAPLPNLDSKKDDNGVEIAEAFGLQSLGTIKPSEIDKLDKNNVYVITIFEKDFKCGNHPVESEKFKNQTWFNEHQHVRKDGFQEFGSKHIAFLKHEDDAWKIVHQGGGDNIEELNKTPYKNSDKYRFDVFSKPQTSQSSQSSSSSGSSKKVICTELYRQDLMSKEIYKADSEFGKYIRNKYPYVMEGYHFWAKPVVRLMQKSKIITKIVYHIAKPWSEEMAYKMGYIEKGNFIGKLLMIIGIPCCYLIGFIINNFKISIFILFNSLFFIIVGFFYLKKRKKQFKQNYAKAER